MFLQEVFLIKMLKIRSQLSELFYSTVDPSQSRGLLSCLSKFFFRVWKILLCNRVEFNGFTFSPWRGSTQPQEKTVSEIIIGGRHKRKIQVEGKMFHADTNIMIATPTRMVPTHKSLKLYFKENCVFPPPSKQSCAVEKIPLRGIL